MEASPIDKAWHVFYGTDAESPARVSAFSTCDCRRSMARGAGKSYLSYARRTRGTRPR